jgi:hypothetical protein
MWLVPNVSSVTSPSGPLIRLKQLDPQAVRAQRNAYTFNKFGAISQHNVLLFPYESAARDYQNHLVLARVSTSPYSFPTIPRYQVQTQLLTLPITGGIGQKKWHIRLLKDDGLNQASPVRDNTERLKVIPPLKPVVS